MTKGQLRALAPIVAVLAFLVAGCGSSDDTTTLTKAEFVKQGNSLCKAHEEERTKGIEAATQTLKPGDSFSDAEQTKLVQSLIIPGYEKTLADLRDLGAPEGDEDEVEEIIAAMEKTLDELEADPEEAIFTTTMFNPPNKLVREYGLKNCAF